MLINTKLKSDYYHLLSIGTLNKLSSLFWICSFVHFEHCEILTFLFASCKCISLANEIREKKTKIQNKSKRREKKIRLHLPLSNFRRETSEFHRVVMLDVAVVMGDKKNLANKFRNENRLFYSCDTRSNDCQVWMENEGKKSKQKTFKFTSHWFFSTVFHLTTQYFHFM